MSIYDKTIYEPDLEEIVVIAINKLLGDKSKYQEQLPQNIATVIGNASTSSKETYDEIADTIFERIEIKTQS